MTMRMLIDARHREETRVAVVKGNRIEEFDFESAERKQLKGNIYLAKVTRVEPSLQAAFIDYGGNRHGFLAFSEIHPDYYQIPKEDREALLREEAEHAAEEEALRAEQDDDDDGYEAGDDHGEDLHDDEGDADADHEEITAVGDDEPEETDEVGTEEGTSRRPRGRGRGNDDQVEALRQRRMNLRRRYKIQDVIRRRQVLLVQVVKEERGNKGAALTTYLSLAGRYCVLMPNTSHGGGISRKISNAGDRKRLKSIMADLKLPPSMGCIVRTAGLQRTKVEIKRDFDYLARLWDGIRDKTLTSSAPSLVYGDSDLIKRAIRDIYNRDIDEVIVEGEEGYRQAREFMKLLMPAHARRVRHYADPVPLFQRSHVEDQLAAMYHPVVQLKSGGYLVINPTEALVSIDINSGRSTREHNIEQTATATNLEAAQEIARQLRLRDMAGLVVIDFIDMDNGSNVRKVEKAMKEALKNDRARIQVGRISSFGLMEMSRQRLRTGVLEASTRGCPHCEGTGLVRTASSAGISALRLIEDEAARGRGSCLTLRCSQEAAFYVLNRKRADIAEIEERYGVEVEVLSDGDSEGARMTVEASGPPPAYAPRFQAIVENDDDLPEEDIEDEEEAFEEDEPAADRAERTERSERQEGEDEGGRKRRRRSRRRRGGRGTDEGTEQADTASEQSDDEADAEANDTADLETAEAGAEPQEGTGEGRRRRGRRGRRGGRRLDGSASAGSGEESTAPDANDGADNGVGDADEDTAAKQPVASVEEPMNAGDVGPITSALDVAAIDASEGEAPVAEAPAEAPRTRRRPRARAAAAPLEAAEAPAQDAPAPESEAPAGDAAKPRRSRRKTAAAADAPEPAADAQTGDAVAEPQASDAPVDAPKPRRSRRKAAAAPDATAAEPMEPETPAPADADVTADNSPTAAGEQGDAEVANDTAAADESGEGEASGTPRRGWWQRTFGA